MKLRTKGNSLRLRVTRSELAQLLNAGSISDAVYLSREEHPGLRYTLRHCHCAELQVESVCREITVTIPTLDIRQWANSDQVGIYRTLDIGPHGKLEVLVEKDFGCLDLPEKDREDLFPNPHAGNQC